MKHKGNLFVVIVGLAAWIHSTWSFSVVIGGDVPAITLWQDVARWLYWVMPGAAAAAAVDVGLISLAAQFRAGSGNRAKLVTFGVLSAISYIGQALFALSHGGKYVPSAGLSPTSTAVASVVWELLIWALPAALPITLLLWAWSDMQPQQPPVTALVPTQDPLTITANHDHGSNAELITLEPSQPDGFTLTCPDCGKAFYKLTEKEAKRALTTHQTLHCTAHVVAESEQ